MAWEQLAAFYGMAGDRNCRIGAIKGCLSWIAKLSFLRNHP
jgi:hypothetical protein